MQVVTAYNYNTVVNIKLDKHAMSGMNQVSNNLQPTSGTPFLMVSSGAQAFHPPGEMPKEMLNSEKQHSHCRC